MTVRGSRVGESYLISDEFEIQGVVRFPGLNSVKYRNELTRKVSPWKVKSVFSNVHVSVSPNDLSMGWHYV